MLDRLQTAYAKLAEREGIDVDEARRLVAVVDDLRWYADRLGAERCDALPRQNRWSFGSHVWYLLTEAEEAAQADVPRPVRYYMDHGRQHVGEVAEILMLFDEGQLH